MEIICKVVTILLLFNFICWSSILTHQSVRLSLSCLNFKLLLLLSVSLSFFQSFLCLLSFLLYIVQTLHVNLPSSSFLNNCVFLFFIFSSYLKFWPVFISLSLYFAKLLLLFFFYVCLIWFYFRLTSIFHIHSLYLSHLCLLLNCLAWGFQCRSRFKNQIVM